MITSARIDALRKLNDNPDTATDFGVTALRAPAIAKLAADDGPLQMSLFDTQDLAEIAPPRLPRRTVDRLPQPRAGRRARPHTPEHAGQATEKLLAGIADRVTRGTLAGAGEIGIAVGKADRQIQDGQALPHHHHRHYRSPTVATPARIDAEAELDGIYVLRTSVDADEPRPRRGSSRATRTSPTSNATSASSRPTTWTCARSTTASTTASKPTC